MKHIKIYILFFCTMLALCPDATAGKAANDQAAFMDLVVNVAADGEKQDKPQMQTARIHYRVNRTVIDRSYMDNDQVLGILDRLFVEHDASDIAYIVIIGSASPEGPPRNNDRLAEQRAAALRNYMLANYAGLHDDQIVTIPRGEDWYGLEAMIEKDPSVPYRESLLRILRSQLPREEQKRRMAALGGGQPYRYLQSHILPHLRGGVSSMIYFKDRPVTIVDTVEVVRVDTVYLEKIVYLTPEPDTVGRNKLRKPFFIAVKNNLLYDLGLLPNLAVEIPFTRNYAWSVEAQANWSWWKTGDPDYWFHRVQIAGVEVRRWLGNREAKNPLNGWYVGAYGYGGTYDIRLFTNKNSDLGQLSNLTWSAGLSLGYATPIARRWNLEFNLSVGYLSGRYYNYYRSDCEPVFPKQSIHDRQYFGPTKAGVSLVWQIGSGVNENYKKKGGKR